MRDTATHNSCETKSKSWIEIVFVIPFHEGGIIPHNESGTIMSYFLSLMTFCRKMNKEDSSDLGEEELLNTSFNLQVALLKICG